MIWETRILISSIKSGERPSPRAAFSAKVAVVATLVPMSAPFVVPMRAALDAISPIEVIAAVVLTLAAIYALFVIGGRVYSGAALQTGGRMKLRDAWRSAGE